MKKSSLIIIVIALVVAFAAVQFMGKNDKSDSNWPKGQKITIIQPFEAGGSADIMARQLVKYWEPELGTNIIIENRPGATGLVGTELFLKQPDDGSVLLVTTQMYLSAGAVLQGAKFTMEDFDVLNFQQFDPMAISVLEDSPYKTYEDLAQAIKERPNTLTCGFMAGGAPHLGAVVLRERAGLEFKDVTYDSGNAYRTALLGKHVDFIASNVNGDRALKGKARVLGVASNERSSIWPDAPTFNELLKIKDFPQLGSARLIAVPKTLRAKYPERYAKLLATYKKAYENPEYVKFRKDTGEMEVSAYRGPDESNKMNKELHSLLERYKERVQATQKK